MIPSLFEFLDPQLIITLIGVSIPLVLYVGVRRFGSLSTLWSETRAMFGTPREFAEDTARDVFTPWGSWGRSFKLRGSPEIRVVLDDLLADSARSVFHRPEFSQVLRTARAIERGGRGGYSASSALRQLQFCSLRSATACSACSVAWLPRVPRWTHRCPWPRAWPAPSSRRPSSQRHCRTAWKAHRTPPLAGDRPVPPSR